MIKLVYLPIDERPCNYRFPSFFKDSMDGIHFVVPPKDILGDMRIEPKHEDIRAFLIEESKDADILVVGLEMLLYGGLVPSRNHFYTKEEILKRLDVIGQIKKNNPKIKIYGFSLIMRCPHYAGSDEEPLYFMDKGQEMFEYGVNEHKHDLGLINDEEYSLEKERLTKVVGEYITDYVSRREVNREVLLKLLEYVKEYFHYFVIPIDDSAPFGYTAIDKNIVLNKIDELKLDIEMYPGADEVGMTLVSRALSDLNRKLKVRVVYPKEECKELVPMYEDRKIRITLASQLKVAGYEETESGEDIVLYMNYPVSDMVNMGSAPSKGYELRDMKSFNEKIIKDIKSGKEVLLCDAAYGNGGEKEFLIDLNKDISLFDIVSYAGWNTSSNTLGTVLYQGMINHFYKNKEAHDLFLAERVLEDIGYCGAVRWDIWHNDIEKFGYDYYNVGEKNGVVAKLLNEKLNTFMKENFPEIMEKYEISKCEFPWRRIFECDVEMIKNNF